MLCEACQGIPLDLFLPIRASARRFKAGKAWLCGYIHSQGDDGPMQLAVSAEGGCPMCKILVTALDAAEPFWAIGGAFSSSGHNMLLHRGETQRSSSGRSMGEGVRLLVRNEGELIVSDGERVGGLNWKYEAYGLTKDVLRQQADCEENFNLARSWLTTCLNEHRFCGADQDATFVPARLIDLGDPATRATVPRLVDMRDYMRTSANAPSYITLSYCWGTDRGKTVPKTTRSNLSLHLSCLDKNRLPKTFVDAMLVVNKLGCRYLWIDALCIVQDDPDDFIRECSQMHLVYSQAQCTIVAADSPDGDAGCFLPRDLDGVQPCTMTLRNQKMPYQRSSIMDIIFERFDDDPDHGTVTIYPNFGPWIKSVQDGPVFQRGWCLQERELSPRVLHYTQNRMLWECRECNAAEDEPGLVPKEAVNKSMAAHLSTARIMDDPGIHSLANTPNGVKLQRHKWDRLVEAYSRRRLSVATDRLTAMSGLAAFFSQRVKDDAYVAGIWKSNLLKEIAWRPKRHSWSRALLATEWPSPPVDGGSPSWSWASHNGEVVFCGDTWYSSSWGSVIAADGTESWARLPLEVELVDVSTQCATVDQFGRVAGGELVLSGWTGSLLLSEAHRMDPDAETDSVFLSKRYFERTYRISVYFDDDVEALPPTLLTLLHLGVGRNARETSSKADNGLVLVACRDAPGKFRRVGMFDLPDEKDKGAWHSVRSKSQIRIV